LAPQKLADPNAKALAQMAEAGVFGWSLAAGRFLTHLLLKALCGHLIATRKR
jgi:hypothetical protein